MTVATITHVLAPVFVRYKHVVTFAQGLNQEEDKKCSAKMSILSFKNKVETYNET